jgi:hypothetical protein
MPELEERVHSSSWKLTIADIANGYGIATVTLRSGVQLEGSVDKKLSVNDVLFLHTQGGWHTIDYTEIAAITGKVRER